MNQNTTSKYYARLSKLGSNELLTILHDCVDILCPVSPAEYAEFCNLSKKAVCNQINANKLMCFEFDDRKYPIINDHLKNTSTPC